MWARAENHRNRPLQGTKKNFWNFWNFWNFLIFFYLLDVLEFLECLEFFEFLEFLKFLEFLELLSPPLVLSKINWNCSRGLRPAPICSSVFKVI